jgi:ATP-dependent DNA ligase
VATLPLTPPLAPMLARLADDVPEGPEWIYEPKWDGFRALVFRNEDEVDVRSRDDRGFVRYFPELTGLLSDRLPTGCIVDAEIVVSTGGGLDFDSLSLRIHPAESRVRHLADALPAGVLAFDLLVVDGMDLSARPLSERLERLRELAPLPAGPGELLDSLATEPSQLLLTPQTDDAGAARAWTVDYEDRGLDGVVAKRLDRPYLFGKRDMVKVKRQRTADCVVGGYRLAKGGAGVGSLLLGLYDDAGILQYVGHTSGLKAGERGEVLDRLRPLEGGSSFGGGRTPGGVSRWTGGRDPSWVALEPRFVVEVRFDRMMGGRFRHAVGLARWRTDKRPEECTFEQVGAS